MQIRTKQIADLLTTCVPITGSTLDVDLNGKILSNLLTPLLIGGTAVGSALTYKTTTGIGTTDAHIFQVGNNGATEAMRILNSGNVGIGTAAPVSLFNISNTPVGGTTGGNPTFTFLDTRNLNAAGWLANTTPLGTIQAYTTDLSTTPSAIGAITFIAPQISASSPSCDISFSTGSSGSLTERMRILYNGKVGIGTTNPTDFVEIADATTTASAAGLVIRQSGANVSTGYAAYFNKTGASVTNIAGYFTATGATNNYAIIVPSTGGRVGIGTATPTAVLQLKAGTATASTAPLKLTSGALLTVAEAGAIEFLTDAYYATITTGAARKTFAFLESNAVNNRGINVTFDGQGIIIPLNTNSIIAAAATNGTITAWFIEGDVSGSIVVDILKNGVSMSGAGNKPTLASALTANAAVSGWTSLSFATNDKLEIKVTTASTTLTKCYLTIKYNIS